MVADKFTIILCYVGDWRELNEEQRKEVYNIAKKYPGTEATSSRMPGEQPGAILFNIGQTISLEQAGEIVYTKIT